MKKKNNTKLLHRTKLYNIQYLENNINKNYI